MLRQPLLFIYWLSFQFFDSPPLPPPFPSHFSQHSQLSHFWLPTPHCVAPVWRTICHATVLVTKCFPSNPCLGKGISQGVTIILTCASAHICSLNATSLVSNLDWYLYVSRLEKLYLWWKLSLKSGFLTCSKSAKWLLFCDLFKVSKITYIFWLVQSQQNDH